MQHQLNTTSPNTTTDTLFQHSVRPEWGLAVMAWDRDGRRGYQFEDGALRVFKRGYYDFLEPADRPLDETQSVLDELNRKIGRRRAAKRSDHVSIPLSGQIDFFAATYAKGFRGVKWTRERRGLDAKKTLKRHRNPVVARARQLFGPERLRAELDAGQAARLIDDLREVLTATSLVTKTHMRGLERVGDGHAERLMSTLHELLVGEGELGRRFDRWVGALRAALGTKPSWSMATAVPALIDPQNHVCVKRTTFARQASWLAPSLTIGKEPGGTAYVRLLDMTDTLADKLQERGFAPHDRLDLYDFIDMTLRPKAIEAIASAAPSSQTEGQQAGENKASS